MKHSESRKHLCALQPFLFLPTCSFVLIFILIGFIAIQPHLLRTHRLELQHLL